MPKIEDKLKYPKHTPVHAKAYWPVTNPTTLKTEHIFVEDVIDGGVVTTDSNNIIRVITTEFSSDHGGSASTAINNTRDALSPTDPSPDGFDVEPHELIIFRVPRSDTLGLSIQIFYDYYQLINTGKGNYGAGGTIIITDDDLFFIRTTEIISLGTSLGADPVLYVVQEEDYLTPENAINSVVVAGGFVITASSDYYFLIQELGSGSAEVLTGNEALYRWIGTTGAFGTASGETTAVSGDFLAVNTISEDTIDKILVPNIIVGAVIGQGSINNIADAVNASFRGIIQIGENMVQSFEVQRAISFADFSVSVVTEQYFYTKGKAVISSDSVESDFILYNSTDIIDNNPATISALPIIESINGPDTDAPEEGVNNSPSLYNIDGSEDFYFIMYDNDVKKNQASNYKTYRFTGAVTGTGTYGNGGAKTAVGGDFLLLAQLTAVGQTKTHLSQFVNDLTFGDVTKVGTPVNNQITQWTGDGTVQGTADLTYDETIQTMNIGDDTTNPSLNFNGGVGANMWIRFHDDSVLTAFHSISAGGAMQINSEFRIRLTIKSKDTIKLYEAETGFSNIELFGNTGDGADAFGAGTAGSDVLKIGDVNIIPVGTLQGGGGLLYVSGTSLWFHDDTGVATDLTLSVGDMLIATYDGAGISEQLVGLVATQTLTNKTLTTPILSLAQSTTPTPTAEGLIEWDTDDHRIAIGDGSTTKLFSDDVVVQARANHTGTQLASTISDFNSQVEAVSVRRVSLTLTASEIKAIGTTPIELIPAGGAGTVINVLSVVFRFNWNSVAFDANALDVKTSGAGTNIFNSAFTLDRTSNTTGRATSVSVALDDLIENIKIVIDGTDSVATGNSTVDVYAVYEVITL